MQIQVDIGFENLVEIVKNLPEEQLVQSKKRVRSIAVKLAKK